MANKIMIVDDDPAIVKMLSIIIKREALGEVIGCLCTGDGSSEEIEFLRPDIVLIDLLLPHTDGIQIVRQLKTCGYKGKCVMISQVQDQQMVSLAYREGVMFFISKPLNADEVVSVVKEALRVSELEASVSIIRSAIMPEATLEAPSKVASVDTVEQAMQKAFSELGIGSETGIDHLRETLLYIWRSKLKHRSHGYQLQDVYRTISPQMPARTVEQRIRRIILKAFYNIAEIGYDDYYHPVFQEYATLLFDFRQIKMEMRRIGGESVTKGKINTRKFVDGLMAKIERDISND